MNELESKFPDVHPFLLKKWVRVFNAFYDRDHSHTLDKTDFYVVIKAVREIYGAESAQMKYAKESLNALWEGLMQLADKNKDAVIELEEWINLLKHSSQQNEAKWFNNYMSYMFKLFDVSADDVLDSAEYADGMAAYGFREHDAQDAFKTFAVDGAGKPLRKIDFPHFKRLWGEYFYSTDPNKLGNNLFGILKK